MTLQEIFISACRDSSYIFDGCEFILYTRFGIKAWNNANVKILNSNITSKATDIYSVIEASEDAKIELSNNIIKIDLPDQYTKAVCINGNAIASVTKNVITSRVATTGSGIDTNESSQINTVTDNILEGCTLNLKSNDINQNNIIK